MQTAIGSGLDGGYALILCDGKQDDCVPPEFPIIRRAALRSQKKAQHLFVLCSAAHLPHAAKFVSELNRKHKLQALFVRNDSDPDLLPQMLERANLRAVRNMLVHSDARVPRRVLTAWLNGAQAELIANAAVAHDTLVVVSCEPRIYEVRFDQMPALKKIPVDKRRDFELAEDGSFIWWRSRDIHLDLDAIRSVIDPVWRRKSARIRRLHGREYGAAIAALRKELGLKQTDVPNTSERQLRRIEQTGAVSVRNLKHLADAHKMTLEVYLDRVAARIQPKNAIERPGLDQL